MDRWVTPAKRVTSPTWSPPPLISIFLSLCKINYTVLGFFKYNVITAQISDGFFKSVSLADRVNAKKKIIIIITTKKIEWMKEKTNRLDVHRINHKYALYT